MKRISAAEYQAMAELRYRIRLFLREGDAAARSAGLEPQQYLLLLAIRGLPADSAAKIQALADSLLIKHHSAVELVDRLEALTARYRRRGDALFTRPPDDPRRKDDYFAKGGLLELFTEAGPGTIIQA